MAGHSYALREKENLKCMSFFSDRKCMRGGIRPMNKIKPILPSLRERKRYLAFEILSEGNIKDVSAVSRAIWDSSLSFSGELGTAEAGIWFLADKYNAELQRGLIKVGHRHVDQLKAGLMMIDRIEREQAIVRSLGVSGIMKKAYDNYVSR
jgi:ribonuclease P/MRP protein subunit POP5